jgi:hypothetical protein
MHQIFFHISMSRQIWLHVHLSSLIGYGFAHHQNQTNKRICTMDTHNFFMFEILFVITQIWTHKKLVGELNPSPLQDTPRCMTSCQPQPHKTQPKHHFYHWWASTITYKFIMTQRLKFEASFQKNKIKIIIRLKKRS